MTGIIILVGFSLIAIILILSFMARTNGGDAPISARHLREIERTLLEIQNYSNDVYARGKASHEADRIRRLLDRD